MSDQLKRLEVYFRILKDKDAAVLPDKHKHRCKEYRQFIIREIEAVKSKIDELKMGAVK